METLSPTGHLAHIHPLVTLVDKLDGQGPVILPRGVPHCEPLILHQVISHNCVVHCPLYLCECVGPRAEDVPVPQADPGNLQPQSRYN